MTGEQRARVRVQEYDTDAEVWKTVETLRGDTFPETRRRAALRRDALKAEHPGTHFRIHNSPVTGGGGRR